MNKIQLFSVAPAVPSELAFLEELPYNLWWCWNEEAIELFRRIDPPLWRETGHNPLDFLRRLGQRRFEALVHDEGFMRHMRLVRDHFDAALKHRKEGLSFDQPARGVAYFSLEYGIHESMGVYSGGLGVLAGDHIKAAADMGLPMVAVGLLYRQGYFQQFLNPDGWQQEFYPENEIHRLPVRKACDEQQRQIHVTLSLPEGQVMAAVWRLDVGRVPLFLLDTNIPENPADFRRITAQLYVSDRRLRLRQELLLGIGGVQALHVLGFDPRAYHMNEGHSAFVGAGRVADLVKRRGLDVKAAAEIVMRTTVFTTHTPVPAGNETFTLDLLRPHLEALAPQLGVDPQEFMSWGLPPQSPGHGEFSMTILGLRLSLKRNGVSHLHGRVARKMWSFLWPQRAEDEIPIGHVTNGIHVPSWLSPDSGILYDRYLGLEWRGHPAAGGVLAHVDQIPDEELWRAHETGRSRLIRRAREMLERQLAARNATRAEIAEAKAVLDHDALTVGFARRFALYKRNALLLKDPDRLKALLCNEERPVQFIFAGKAHPADNHSKDLIRQIVHFARDHKVRRRIIFLEDYNIYTARCLVQGVDVWLNTPHRPQEASGTSGMKAAVNGALHVSILDGWWCEGYSKECGWAIGHGEEYDDPQYADTIESQALYNLLEDEVVPCFYDRSAGDLPANWIRMMKASIKMAIGYFTSHRMVAEYNMNAYEPAMAEFDALLADKARRAVELVAQNKRLASLWPAVRVETPAANRDVSVMHVGGQFTVSTTAHLGQLRPEEVDVEVYYGPVNSENRVVASHVEKMVMVEDLGQGRYVYRQEIPCRATGRYGFTARVTPGGPDFKSIMPGFVTWADGTQG